MISNQKTDLEPGKFSAFRIPQVNRLSSRDYGQEKWMRNLAGQILIFCRPRDAKKSFKPDPKKSRTWLFVIQINISRTAQKQDSLISIKNTSKTVPKIAKN